MMALKRSMYDTNAYENVLFLNRMDKCHLATVNDIINYKRFLRVIIQIFKIDLPFFVEIILKIMAPSIKTSYV